MKSSVCTLFEGHYHYGVAALVNSLHKSGFQGDIYAGYRGELPFWANVIEESKDCKSNGEKVMEVESNLFLHFLPVDTDYHLTNYKPNFMLKLLNGPAKNADNIFYFDPDIIIKTEWGFFERWANYGVAVVHEIVMNDMPISHPYRYKWEEVLDSIGIPVHNNLTSYINAGFIGLKRDNFNLLNLWKDVMNCGYAHFDMKPNQFSDRGHNRHHPFYMQDQDGLNITLMGYNGKISETGPEFMDFLPGGKCMSHAVGSPKPWRKNLITNWLNGYSISAQDKAFWDNATYPIKLFSLKTYKFKLLEMKIVSFMSRFYSKK